MQNVAYWLAVVMVATSPPALLYWYLIHPLAAFWRRLGPVVTFVVVGAICLVVVYLLWQVRDFLLGPHLGFHWWLIAGGCCLYAGALWLEVLCRRHLKMRILAGVPELGGDPGRLLTEGIYARTRNPRYLVILMAVFAWAMILNYLGLWILALLMIPAMYLLIVLEEQELKGRFGAEYEAYLEAVPRLIPRIG